MIWYARLLVAACAAGEIKLLYVVGSRDLLSVLGEESVLAALEKVETMLGEQRYCIDIAQFALEVGSVSFLLSRCCCFHLTTQPTSFVK